MLVLTRRINETIVINGDIHVTIIGTQGSQVKIGVDAPKHVSVNRLEIEQRKNAN